MILVAEVARDPTTERNHIEKILERKQQTFARGN